jgi:AcrR family transcriptional regulator
MRENRVEGKRRFRLSTPTEQPRPGLRERKRAKTRATIQVEALRLFREHGYDATTVEQICEAAEVSESTFYRYFPTKPDVVLRDEFDPLIIAAFNAQPAELSSLRALREAFKAVFAQMSPAQEDEQRQRTLLALAVPELRAAMIDQFAQAIQLIADGVAARTGHAEDELAVRTLAGAVVGVAMAVMLAIADDEDADFAGLIDEALAQLETGLASI